MPCFSYGPPNSYSTFLVAIGSTRDFAVSNELFAGYQKSCIGEGDLIPFTLRWPEDPFICTFEYGAIRNESHPV